MHVISRKRLLEFAEVEKDAYQPLDDWFRIAKSVAWENVSDVRKIFPTADKVGKCTIFNIGGNKYRLIVKIEYLKQQIYIKFVLTHKEYDRDKWKAEC